MSLIMFTQIPSSAPPIDSFLIRDRDQRGPGQVSLSSGIALAHRLMVAANFPEDRSPRHASNQIVIDEDRVSIRLLERVGVSYERRSGRLISLWIIPPQENRASNVGVDEAAENVRDYYQVAGGVFPLVISRASIEADSRYIHVVAKYRAPGTNYLFSSGVEAIVDRTYGTPENMWIGVRPNYDLPTSVIPKADALTTAAYVMARYAGWNDSEVAADEPTFRVPDFRGMPHRMRAIEHSRAQAGRAGLYYEVTVKDGSQAGLPEPRRKFAWVMIDASSGEPIAIHPAYQLIGQVSKESPAPPFSWGKKAWRAQKQIGLIQSVETEAPKTGKSVVLSQGRRFVVAQFDRRSGLVWTTDRTQKVIGKVSSNLARELKALKSPKIPDIPKTGGPL